VRALEARKRFIAEHTVLARCKDIPAITKDATPPRVIEKYFQAKFRTVKLLSDRRLKAGGRAISELEAWDSNVQ
jgi:hypothetical protein